MIMNRVTEKISPESFYEILDTHYIAVYGAVSLRMSNNDLVTIFKLGILFDGCWIRYADKPGGLINKTLNLNEVKGIVG